MLKGKKNLLAKHKHEKKKKPFRQFFLLGNLIVISYKKQLQAHGKNLYCFALFNFLENDFCQFCGRFKKQQQIKLTRELICMLQEGDVR